MKQLLYTLDEPYSYAHQLFAGVKYQNDWITIHKDTLSIRAGYAWDGCTPKWQPLGLITLGTPDGALRFGRPWLYYQSLVHDALCQFRRELPFSQQVVTQIWRDHLREAKWPLWRLYVVAVDTFGPQDFGPS